MWHKIEESIFPPTCVVTGEKATSTNLDIGEQILNQLQLAKEICPICARYSLTNRTCGKCLKEPPIITLTQVGYLLDDILKEMIHQYKYHNQLFYSKLFAELLSPKINQKKVEALIPVPLHINRLSTRGFNQSLELAKFLAKNFNLPIIEAISRVIDTPQQTNLTKKERKKNLQGAFTVNKILLKNINSIAIVDDVITTGTTINEIAKLLHKSKRSLKIQAWAIAKTPKLKTKTKTLCYLE